MEDTNLKPDKLTLSKAVIEGLRHLGTSIESETARKLIANCVKLTLHPQATIPPVPEIYASNSLRAKQSEYAVVSLFSLATKHCLDGMYLRQLLEEIELANSTIEELTKSYEDNKKSLILRHLQIGHSFPHITDLQWRIVADVKSSTSESSSGEPSFYINMGRFRQNSEGDRETIAEFVCNTEELQLLINKLKEVERHCEKLSNEL
ncbi:COMM domain-containing protein 3 [Stomoxys calcitrans]|uniref:COMM domain-containing protein 3 n=1 Tax=Stomoxys calcitrans TaxID=35570 RepID=A0A1I8PCX8_STOCA|nr:COMM domain-containing protein 3 [Stomoxys calcitrans]